MYVQMRILQYTQFPFRKTRRRVILLSRNNKRVRKEIRLTQTEYDYIKKNARRSGLSASAYMRSMIKDIPTIDPAFKKQLNNLINEINYIGHNINQIVKNNNSGLYSDFDKSRLMEYMRILNEKVDLLLEQNGNK